MAETSVVLTDNSRLSLVDRVLFRLETVLTFMGGIVIMLLILLATANVLGRWIFSLPVSGYIDWVEQAMAFFAFLGLAYTQRQGGHIRMDVLIGRLRGRGIWFAELVSVVLMFLITLILIYGSFLHFLRAYQIGDSSLDINLPTWPAKLVVPVAFTVLALRLALQIVAYFRAVKQGAELPVAVPLIEDAASAAAAEAKSILGDEVKPKGNP